MEGLISVPHGVSLDTCLGLEDLVLRWLIQLTGKLQAVGWALSWAVDRGPCFFSMGLSTTQHGG